MKKFWGMALVILAWLAVAAVSFAFLNTPPWSPKLLLIMMAAPVLPALTLTITRMTRRLRMWLRVTGVLSAAAVVGMYGWAAFTAWNTQALGFSSQPWLSGPWPWKAVSALYGAIAVVDAAVLVSFGQEIGKIHKMQGR